MRTYMYMYSIPYYPLVGSLRLLKFGSTLFGGGYSGQPYTHRCAAAGTLRDGDLVRVRVRVRVMVRRVGGRVSVRA